MEIRNYMSKISDSVRKYGPIAAIAVGSALTNIGCSNQSRLTGRVSLLEAAWSVDNDATAGKEAGRAKGICQTIEAYPELKHHNPRDSYDQRDKSKD